VKLQLKPISREGISEALSKVEVYRYLNEPGEAESICRDILDIDPENQAALRLLGLTITDQFKGDTSDRYVEAETAFRGLIDRYNSVYHLGLLQERKAKAQLRAGRPPHAVMPVFEQAMNYFEEAERIRPTNNDDAILRWNRCVRLLESRMDSEWRKEIDEFDASEGPPV
jgi:tetratricopeptide (TPR) repeat protein